MENASKALIIAGAILISILLISVGIIIMNAINNPVQQGASAADSQAIEMYNSKFTAYDGKQKGSTLRGLASIVAATNASDKTHTVTVTGFDTNGLSKLDSNTTYNVTLKYADEDKATGVTFTGTNVWAGPAATAAKTKAGFVYEIQIAK